MGPLGAKRRVGGRPRRIKEPSLTPRQIAPQEVRVGERVYLRRSKMAFQDLPILGRLVKSAIYWIYIVPKGVSLGKGGAYPLGKGKNMGRVDITGDRKKGYAFYFAPPALSGVQNTDQGHLIAKGFPSFNSAFAGRRVLHSPEARVDNP